MEKRPQQTNFPTDHCKQQTLAFNDSPQQLGPKLLFVIVQVTWTTPMMKALCSKICYDVVWNGIKLVPLPGSCSCPRYMRKACCHWRTPWIQIGFQHIDAHARQTRYYKPRTIFYTLSINIFPVYFYSCLSILLLISFRIPNPKSVNFLAPELFCSFPRSFNKCSDGQKSSARPWWLAAFAR